jgi:hypothetical protein
MSFFSLLDPKSVDNRQSERWKVLSSDQLFLGIIRSPRPGLLNIAPGKMGEALGTEYPRFALESLYGRQLRLKELERRAHVIVIQMNTPAPVGRTREADLGWFDKHTPRSMQLMEQLWAIVRCDSRAAISHIVLKHGIDLQDQTICLQEGIRYFCSETF